MDWIDGNDQLEHDYESGEVGGNRFATILLYMTDLGESDGGETGTEHTQILFCYCFFSALNLRTSHLLTMPLDHVCL
jgi:hypothetical protein